MQIPIILIILAILLIILFCSYWFRKKELFDGRPETAYTNPKPGDKLRNEAQLPATVIRSSNTILTAAPVYGGDALDKLTLPKKVQDEFNEWIDLGYISPIKDQMLCGGCWAFASCGSLADRQTIATAGKWYAPFGLSEQLMISCGNEMNMLFYQGCQGGIPHYAIDAMEKYGIPADSKCLECGGIPAEVSNNSGGGSGGVSRSGVVNPNNASTCTGGGSVYAGTDYTWWQTGCDTNTGCNLSAATTCPCNPVIAEMKRVSTKETPFDVRYKTIGGAHNYSKHSDTDADKTVDLWPDIPQNIIDDNVQRMKKAIYYEGPITIGYRVTADFYTFWAQAAVDNFYRYDGRSQMTGGHAIVVVGWKKIGDTPVWICKNSWGENGGYGFPKGPKWINPITGKKEIKYIGGFWNHVMGENDSFFESNSTGAHPDLTVPAVAKFLPNGGKDIKQDWYKTQTLRDVWQTTLKFDGTKPSEKKVEPKKPSETKKEKKVDKKDSGPRIEPGVDITSDKFKIVNLTPINVSTGSITEFFSEDGLFLVGANSAKNVQKIVDMFNIAPLGETDVEALAAKIKGEIKDYVVVAIRGKLSVYYMLDGDPKYWDFFGRNFVGRTVNLTNFVGQVFPKIQALEPKAPIVQISKK